MKKNLLLLVTITILFCLFPTGLKAFNGYDISFSHISGRTYEFNLEFYNIDARTPPSSVVFDVFSTCGIAGQFGILNQNNTTILPPNCSPNPIPLKRTSYSGTYTFPTNGCSDFILVLDINIFSNYANISTSGNNSGILINGVGLYSNSSPKIINTPKYLSINNHISSYNLHATDPDGDSLVYKLAQPPGSFNTGYTTNSPFGVNQYCTLDSTTGILKGNMVNYPLLLSVEIEEYRKQILIGTTHRVWSIYAANSTTLPVTISEINYNQGFDTTFCTTDSVFFEFKAAAGNNPANVVIDSNKFSATVKTFNGISYFKMPPNGLLKTNTPYHFYVNATSGCDVNTQIFTIRFDSCITTSIQEKKLNNFQIYPNPSKGNFTLNLNDENLNSTVSVRSITGQLLKEFQVLNSQQQFNISELESGIYFISIPTKSGLVSKKIILTK
jgi:hypothetical protein